MENLQTRVYRHLSGMITQGDHGKLLPSQSQLCQELGVSIITVRRALDELESSGAIYRQQGKGIFIRKINPPKSNLRLFMVLPCHADIKNEFFSGIMEAARAQNGHVLFYNYHEADVDLFNQIKDFEPNAVLWIAPNAGNHAALKRLLELHSHIMVFNRQIEWPMMNYITGDHYLDGITAAQVLLKKRPESIVYVGCDPLADHSKLRYEGFISELKRQNYPLGDINAIPVNCADYQPDALTSAIKAKLKAVKPAAIACSQGAFLDDLRDALIAAKSNWQNMEIINFNAITQDHLLKPVTHELVQPVEKMGVKAIEALNNLVGGRAGNVKMKFESELILKRNI